MSLMMERYLRNAGISTPMGRVLDKACALAEAANYSKYSGWHQLPFLHVVDADERGEYRAHVEDIEGNEVMSYGSDEDGEIDMINDGFMRNTDDMRGLLHHLQQHHLLPHNAVIYTSHSDFERAVNKYNPDDDVEESRKVSGRHLREDNDFECLRKEE